ncbi:hypothetical protein Aph01nite_56530 [Acrocarpospora phusangensis]|uniref:Uncharacterized protein n=1 Tax=Acrocarpospora phusangensis TaxID=1070424 RepID=A0A919QGX6_9ACTN|nr:hypothetical protein Aph01nite_56530 [Acrocarpospora phusangensis]
MLEAIARGKARGTANYLLLCLYKAGLELSEADRERVLSCTDQEQLAIWVKRAPYVDRAEDMFTDPDLSRS